MTRTVMVALMNIDDAYDKDLHFVFPSGLQTTKDKHDRGLQREKQCATPFIIILDLALKPLHALYTLYLYAEYVQVNDLGRVKRQTGC